VASEGADSNDLAGGTHEPRECMACRGTGRVISNLGGTPSAVACPWCSGSGLRQPEIDAQAHWASDAQDDAPSETIEAEPADGPSADG
jgi:hypothetical protein